MVAGRSNPGVDTESRNLDMADIQLERRVARLESYRETDSAEIKLLRTEVHGIRKDTTTIVASMNMAKWTITSAIALGPALGVLFAKLFG